MAKLLHGRADELLSLMCLARPIDKVPLLLAPAMNREMWAHPATQRNMAQLAADGAHILGVGSGFQACGETGDGRMLEPPELLEDIIAFFQPKRLAGKQVLVTAGPDLRSDRPGARHHQPSSSGKMGFAIARAAREAGAEVTLVAGPVSLPTPRGVTRIDVKSAQDMLRRHAAAGRSSPTYSSPRPPWPTGGPPRAATQKIKKDGSRASRRRSPSPKTPTSWPPWPNRRAPSRRAVLRGLRGRKPRPRGQRPGQARAQGRAAAGG